MSASADHVSEQSHEMSGERGPTTRRDPLEVVAEAVARLLGVSARTIEEIAPGLGDRRFFRVRLEPQPGRPQSLVARLEPERPADASAAFGIAPEPPLEPIRRLLEAAGLPVPARYAGAAALGIDLLEDLGDESLERAALRAHADERSALYTTACGLLPRLQRLSGDPARVAAFGRRLDAALIDTKRRKWMEWALPALLAREPSAAEGEAVRSAFEEIARVCEAAPRRLAHRDFKAANLLLRRPPGAPPELVMIDLQGAFLAPPEYDLVCLLRDSHVPLPEPEQRRLLEATRPLLPAAPSAAEFDRRFELLTLSRVGKDVAHYLHAARARGDRRYLRFVSTGLVSLCAAARAAAALDPRFAALRDLLEEAAAGWRHDEAPPCVR